MRWFVIAMAARRSSVRAPRLERALVVLVSAGALWGCGPTRYLKEVSGSARHAVIEARAAGAEELAPYEYWSAHEYLAMAKDTAARADFEQSLEYGNKAERMARRAKRAAYEAREARETPRDQRVRAQIPTRIP